MNECTGKKHKCLLYEKLRNHTTLVMFSGKEFFKNIYSFIAVAVGNLIKS